MAKDTTKNWQKIREEAEKDMQGEESSTESASADEAALDHPSYAVLEEKLTLAEQQAHENWEKAVRAMAELDNVRRRAERDVANAHRYGQEKLINGFIPIIDSLEQAIQLTQQNEDDPMYQGLQLTLKLFTDLLQKNDVIQLDPQGEPFNPQEHEAMSMQEVPGAEPNTVLAVFQKGYKLNDRVIRPARVIVTKPKPINEKA